MCSFYHVSYIVMDKSGSMGGLNVNIVNTVNYVKEK